MEKVEIGQVFSEYFGFLCQSSFHQLLHNHPLLSSGAGTIGQKWPQYKGLSSIPVAIKNMINATSIPSFLNKSTRNIIRNIKNIDLHVIKYSEIFCYLIPFKTRTCNISRFSVPTLIITSL
jgi:hypothetical protein